MLNAFFKYGRSRSGLALLFAGMAYVSACATNVLVSTTAMPGADLSRYKTFLIQTHEPDAANQTKSDISKILEARVAQELVAHGLTAVTDHSDLTFSYATERRVGYSGEEQWEYQEGALVLNARDTRADKIIWTAHAQVVIDPRDKVHRQLEEGIQKIFAHYPHIKTTSEASK